MGPVNTPCRGTGGNEREDGPRESAHTYPPFLSPRFSPSRRACVGARACPLLTGSVGNLARGGRRTRTERSRYTLRAWNFSPRSLFVCVPRRSWPTRTTRGNITLRRGRGWEIRPRARERASELPRDRAHTCVRAHALSSPPAVRIRGVAGTSWGHGERVAQQCWAVHASWFGGSWWGTARRR